MSFIFLKKLLLFFFVFDTFQIRVMDYNLENFITIFQTENNNNEKRDKTKKSKEGAELASAFKEALYFKEQYTVSQCRYIGRLVFGDKFSY